jgi:endonuclease/exonuclease/phosphatase family metal-dependent hydrolase
VRIVTYNILDGGVGRADPIGEVLEAQRADIVVLIEADDDYVVDRTAKRLKMDLIVAPGHGHRVAILTRFTLVQTINHALLGESALRSCCEAIIRLPDGTELPVIGLHLHARATEADETARQHEIATVLRLTHDYRTANRPHILVGDFNSTSPVQVIDPDKLKQTARDAYVANGNQIPRRVIENLLDHGYFDTLHVVRGEAATTLASFTTHEPGQRVDYVFTFGIDRSRITEAWVEQDRLATFASDHYPVGAQIDVG